MIFETKKRSVIKTVTWKVIATSITFLTLYFFTGSFLGSVKITAVAAILGMISFYIHERVWNHVAWGKIDNE